MSSSSSPPVASSEQETRLPLKSSIGSNLARIAPFTSEVVARRRATKAELAGSTKEAAKGTTLGVNSSSEDEEAADHRGNYKLERSTSKVTRAQLDVLRVRFHIAAIITIRVPAQGEMPFNVMADKNEISFPVITFECGFRFLLALYVRQFLSELHLHPL